MADSVPHSLDCHRVFLKDGEETEPEICVDLLLDASQSRMHSQEVLSAEAVSISPLILPHFFKRRKKDRFKKTVEIPGPYHGSRDKGNLRYGDARFQSLGYGQN